MPAIWVLGYLILWAVVVLNLLLLAVLARQVGLIHQRIPPAPARTTNDGPEIGDPAPLVEGHDLGGNRVVIGGPAVLPSLLVFMSPGCGSCSDLVPSLKSISRSERKNLKVYAVSLDPDVDANKRFVEAERFRDVPLVVAPAAATGYDVRMTPYAVLLDRDGNVVTKGVTNHLEHFESLLMAAGFSNGSSPRPVELEGSREGGHDI